MSSHTDFVVKKRLKKRSAPPLSLQPELVLADDADDDNAPLHPPPQERPAKKPKKAKPKKAKVARSTVRQRTMNELRASFGTAVSSSTTTASTKTTVKQKSNNDDDGSSDSTIDLTNDLPETTPTTISDAAAVPTATAPTNRARVNEWPGVVTMARNTGISSVTTVDPGTRNFAITRLEFLPKMRVTHLRVLDLHELCSDYEDSHPTTKLGDEGTAYTIDALLYVLGEYIRQEISKPNGCFNSSFVIVEEQSFDRNMARVESCVVSVVNSAFGGRFHVNGANNVPRGQIVSSRSVKSCYRLLFPDLPPEAAASAASTSRRAFGMGDVHGNRIAERQRLENKKNAIKYGKLILAQSRIEDVVPAANLTDRDRKRLLRAKCDDIYDTLFLATYFASSYLFWYNKAKVRTDIEQITFNAIEAPPQRPHNCWQELFELCAAIGTPQANVQELLDVLLKPVGSHITVRSTH